MRKLDEMPIDDVTAEGDRVLVRLRMTGRHTGDFMGPRAAYWRDGEASISGPAMKTLGEETPLKRQGQPAELASAFVLLASDEGSYMTGAVVPVAGGMTIV